MRRGLDARALVVDALVKGWVVGYEIKKGVWGGLEEIGGGGCHVDKRSLRVVAAFEEDGEGEGVFVGVFSSVALLTELEKVGKIMDALRFIEEKVAVGVEFEDAVDGLRVVALVALDSLR